LRTERLVLTGLCALALATLGLPGPGRPGPAAALNSADWDIPGGHFFTQTRGGAPAGYGYSVTDDAVAPFWSEFQRLGGVEAVGYPVSRRFVWNGFVVQAFQKAIFQWRPEVGRVYFVNVFDEFTRLGKDGWLEVVRSTPRPAQFNEQGLSWDQIIANRLKLLDDYPAIRAAYFGVGDWLNLNGLPLAPVKDYGNVRVLRAQRVIIQQWLVDVPWARAGQVVFANGGDVAKEAGIIPQAATQPEDGGLVGLDLWGYYVAYDHPASYQSLTRAISHLDHVIGYFYQLSPDGQITGSVRPEVLRIAAAYGRPLHVMVKNQGDAEFGQALADPARRRRLVEAVLGLLADPAAAGLHLDIENLPAGSRDDLTRFVSEVAAGVRARYPGKVLSQAVPARTRDLSSGWAAPYDYGGLAAQLDYFVLMAYGFRTEASPTPGPTAPADWLAGVLAYTVDRVPREKLVVALPWWGLDWNLATGPPAISRRYSDIPPLMAGGDAAYVPGLLANRLRYTQAGQAHEVWFEDRRSFLEKVDLVRRYGIARVAGWRLGHEDPAIWQP